MPSLSNRLPPSIPESRIRLPPTEYANTIVISKDRDSSLRLMFLNPNLVNILTTIDAFGKYISLKFDATSLNTNILVTPNHSCIVPESASPVYTYSNNELAPNETVSPYMV